MPTEEKQRLANRAVDKAMDVAPAPGGAARGAGPINIVGAALHMVRKAAADSHMHVGAAVRWLRDHDGQDLARRLRKHSSARNAQAHPEDLHGFLGDLIAFVEDNRMQGKRVGDGNTGGDDSTKEPTTEPEAEEGRQKESEEHSQLEKLLHSESPLVCFNSAGATATATCSKVPTIQVQEIIRHVMKPVIETRENIIEIPVKVRVMDLPEIHVNEVTRHVPKVEEVQEVFKNVTK